MFCLDIFDQLVEFYVTRTVIPLALMGSESIAHEADICMRINNHFHINGFALSLALKQRLEATQKWSIGLMGVNLVF